MLDHRVNLYIILFKSVNVMKKNKGVSSSNMMPKRRKHFQDYLDITHNIVTPNQRSLPKYKNIFPPSKREKSAKKDHITVKRHSQGKLDRKKEKENNSPPHPANRSTQKYNRLEGSINREYDSPSKDNEEIDFIVRGVNKKGKGNSFIESTIERVN